MDSDDPGVFVPHWPGILNMRGTEVVTPPWVTTGDYLFFARFEKPNSCAEFASSLTALAGKKLDATREVRRKEGSDKQHLLTEQFRIDIPILIGGQKATLQNNPLEWVESGRGWPVLEFGRPQKSIVNSVHFQGESLNTCEGSNLTIWVGSGPLSPYPINSPNFVVPFGDEAKCQEGRKDLLAWLKQVDPQNNGHVIQIHRTIEVSHKLSEESEPLATCHEVQVERISATVGGLKFTGGATSFPIVAVDRSLCR